MKEKANARCNDRDRGSKFASLAKARADFLWVIYEIDRNRGISNRMRSLILNCGSVNGQERQLRDWSQINWRKVKKVVRNLQRRIFRARKLGYKSTKSGGLK